MNRIIEALILYLILFMPGMIPNNAYPEAIAFSMTRELIRLFAYTLPGLTAIWFLLFLYKRDKNKNSIPKPCIKDMTTFMVCLPGLFLIGFGVSGLSSLAVLAGAVPLPLSPRVEAPGSLPAWLVLGASCLGTGYLEESYFRVYLFQRLKEAGLRTGKAVFIATLLFAGCHIYEGPWGILNAALAGLGLSLVLAKQRAIHGIAWAHGGYNAFVYILGELKA